MRGGAKRDSILLTLKTPPLFGSAGWRIKAGRATAKCAPDPALEPTGTVFIFAGSMPIGLRAQSSG